MQGSWYNQERVRQPGSVVLASWLASRDGGVARAGVAPSLQASSQYNLRDREAMAEIFQMPTAAAGVPVTVTNATQVSAVYACLALICGAISTLPLSFYQRTDNGGRKGIKHDFWWLFNEQPSALMPAAVFWEYVALCMFMHGDGLAWIIRDRNGKPIEVVPLSPLEVQIERKGRELVYYVNSPDLGVFGVDQADMLHFYGFGFNGRRSLSVIKHVARQAIGTALAADQFAGAFFARGATPQYALKYAGKMDQLVMDQLRDQFQRKLSGLDNAYAPLVLTQGGDVKELSLSAEDAQLLESRRFQVEDIARALGVPPHMIGATDKTTSWGSGVESMGQGFVTFTLQRHLRRFEQEINRKLFRTATYFCEFNVSGLLRGDLKARGEYYRQAIGGAQGPGWLSANEIRGLENMEPADGGEELYTSATPAPVDPTPTARNVADALDGIAAAMREAPPGRTQADTLDEIAAIVRNMPAPQVTIAEGAVQVAAPAVTVEGAQVNVQAYPKRVEETYSRNGDGELTGAIKEVKD